MPGLFPMQASQLGDPQLKNRSRDVEPMSGVGRILDFGDTTVTLQMQSFDREPPAGAKGRGRKNSSPGSFRKLDVFLRSEGWICSNSALEC